jgi:hypothetical protein
VSQDDYIPKLHIVVVCVPSSEGHPSHYQWSITLKSPDAKGERSLGYRGSGVIKGNLTGLLFNRGPEVHDENLPRWTPMNPTDRPDIRLQLTNLATKAATKLKDSGEDKFEHIIP